MKRVFRQILGWGMMLTLPLVMTSCEWFFDMLDNPITPALQVLRAQLTLKVGESKPIQASTQAHVVYRTEIFSENTTTVEVTVTKKDGSISFATADFTKHVGDAAFTNPVTIVGDGTVSYSSDNEEVAKVNPTTGEVTIIGKGLATIKASTIDTDMFAYKTKTTQYTLKVYRFIDLATITSDFTAENYDALTGTLAGNYKICIAEFANVELKDVTINGVNNVAYKWAGLTCDGNATITITGTNSVKGFFSNYPGIQAGPIGTTLTISGTGSLTATGGDSAAGIGSGFSGSSCGNITISGGTVNASSGGFGAGIGSGFKDSSCGNITISGGTVNASSGQYGAGIGSGYVDSSCGNITISGGTVYASSNEDGAGIGSGYADSSCGDISISGGTIVATSAKDGAGIGSGQNSSFGSITITSDITKVKATRNHSAAWPIGKGLSDQSSSSSQVKIAGVIVTSKSWDGTSLPDLNFATSSTGGNNLTWTLTSTTAP